MKTTIKIGIAVLFAIICAHVFLSTKKTAIYSLGNQTIVRVDRNNESVFSLYENGEKQDEVRWSHEKPPYEDSGTIFCIFWDIDTIYILGNSQWYRPDESLRNLITIIYYDDYNQIINGGDFHLSSLCQYLTKEGRRYKIMNSFEAECRINQFDELNPILIQATYSKGRKTYSNF